VPKRTTNDRLRRGVNQTAGRRLFPRQAILPRQEAEARSPRATGEATQGRAAERRTEGGTKPLPLSPAPVAHHPTKPTAKDSTNHGVNRRLALTCR
jgi:hypothetical protein